MPLSSLSGNKKKILQLASHSFQGGENWYFACDYFGTISATIKLVISNVSFCEICVQIFENHDILGALLLNAAIYILGEFVLIAGSDIL